MKATRFDTLTRRMARAGSRRTLLRAVAGGLAAAVFVRVRGNVDAAPNSVPRGGVCYHDRQCINDYYAPGGAGLNPLLQEVYCRDNGFWYDGELNCCRYEGGFCDYDEECCGGWSCVNGFCGSWEPYDETLGDVTDDILPGITNGVGTLGLGQPCFDAAQCYSGSGTETTCAANGIDYGGVCCTFYGFGCVSDRHCCGSLQCLGGICTVPYEGFG